MDLRVQWSNKVGVKIESLIWAAWPGSASCLNQNLKRFFNEGKEGLGGWDVGGHNSVSMRAYTHMRSHTRAPAQRGNTEGRRNRMKV